MQRYKKNGLQDAHCENRGQDLSYVQSKINHLGEEVTEQKICSSVVEKLVNRVEKISTTIRVNLSLIHSYQRYASNNSFNIRMERPINREKLKRQLSPREVAHLESLVSESLPLELLNDQEIDEALNKHYTTADEIRRKFLQSYNYKNLYKDLEPEVVINYLKNGSSGSFIEASLSQIKKTLRPHYHLGYH